MALTTAKRKLIRSLGQKKYRQQKGLFVAEGVKIVQDLLKSDFQVEEIFIGEDLLDRFSTPPEVKVTILDDEEFSRISFLKNPQPVLAIVHQKHWKIDINAAARNDLILVLDKIQDPGNLGTILRIADWFGIKAIVASQDTVDVYNPKVVQASMGAVFRVPVVYGDLQQLLGKLDGVEIYGTFMDGENIYTSDIKPKGMIVMGNEANGIEPHIERLITKRLTIPSFNTNYHIDSLNVAVATAIVVSEFSRRING